MSKLKNTYGFSDDVLKAVLDIHVNEAALSSKHKRTHHKPVQEARTALDKTYPHGANDIATLAVQVRALLNFLSKSGVLKK